MKNQGCTRFGSSNHDPMAKHDDGSCYRMVSAVFLVEYYDEQDFLDSNITHLKVFLNDKFYIEDSLSTFLIDSSPYDCADHPTLYKRKVSDNGFYIYDVKIYDQNDKLIDHEDQFYLDDNCRLYIIQNSL